jgi:two-component system, chemotaxis family, response regulator Rcp1
VADLKLESPVQIMLVEDNPGDIRLIVETLSEGKIPYKITVAKDGEEALNMLEKKGFCPEMILLDLKLPKKSGLEVLAGVRGNPATKNTPVIVLSSSDSEGDITKAYELQANCYVTKPIDLDKFIVTINSINDFWLTIVRLAR